MKPIIALDIAVARGLKKAREEKGLSTFELAMDLNITGKRPDVNIGQRERNGCRSMRLIIDHCMALGIDPKTVIDPAVDAYVKAKKRNQNNSKPAQS